MYKEGAKAMPKDAEQWDTYFSRTASTNNIQVHQNYKEYFDKPINYSIKGY
jgi:hypothetical protein